MEKTGKKADMVPPLFSQKWCQWVWQCMNSYICWIHYSSVCFPSVIYRSSIGSRLICLWLTAGYLAKSENGWRANRCALRHKVDSEDWRHSSSQFPRETIPPRPVSWVACPLDSAVSISNAEREHGMHCTDSLHILQQYLPDRPSLNYSLRPRRFGAVGSDVGRINEVTLRRARLVLGWVTVSGFNSRCGKFIWV